MATVPPPAQVVQMQPVTQMADPTGGLGFLVGVDGLFFQQKLEIFEAITGCDTKNRYHITPVPAGMPDPTPKEWVENFKATAAAAPLLKAKEESQCIQRIFCPQFREFTMGFQDGQGAQFFSLHRPFHCTMIFPCCMLYPQEITLNNANNVPVAKVVENFKCCWCFTRQFNAMDAQGNTQYLVNVPECYSSRGCNICAPSCFNESYDMDILDPKDETVIGVMSSIFPGCNCGGLTERSNLLLRFPPGSTPEQRATLVATIMLIEFAHFEWKRQQDKNNGGS